MKKRKSSDTPAKRIIDMTEYGPVQDICPDGYADFDENLGRVLHQLYSGTRKVTPNTWVRVFVSDISSLSGENEEEVLERVSIERVYTLKKLLALWGGPFDETKYQKWLHEKANNSPRDYFAGLTI